MDDNLKDLAVSRLIKAFNYEGALEILDLYDQFDQSLIHLIDSCRWSMNFDFAKAESVLKDLPEKYILANPSIQRYVQELPSLRGGGPDEVFNELMDNIMIQLKRGTYTEFAGRVFQLRELLYKYAVIQFKEGKIYPLRDRIYQKQFFEHRYKLHHGLMNGMKEILTRAGGKWEKIVHVLSGKAMGELMDLRHKTIVAHGIETIRLQDIERIYESAENVLDDIEKVFNWLNIPRREHKYRGLNRVLCQLLAST
ncbi:MAG TPA: hypothetical protein VJ824_08195 [Bacillota bacterium]|nr:hypothetical protein [Bacillota bacterium]